MTVVDETKFTFGTFEDRAVWLIGKLLPDFPQWTYLDACACAGNFGRESGIQMIQEGGQTPPNGGWGFAQWTGPRRRAFETYCARSGRSPSAMSTGYAYTFVELKGEFAKVVDLVAAAPSLEAKVAAFEQHYEMAGVVAMADRLAFAVRAQKAWDARGPEIPPPVTPTPEPAPTPVPTQGTPRMSGLFAGLFGWAAKATMGTALPFVVPYIIDAITKALPSLGLSGNTTLTGLITAIVTGIGVYATPNAKK